MVDVGELVRFTPGERTLRLVMDIAAALERYRIVMEGPAGVRLRKLNHIRTIRGTTAIEGNTLTEDQVTDIIAGKRVVGSKREIDEVKGAHAAYSKVEAFDPLSPRALLRAHALMTKGLVESPGKWRKCNVGVFNARLAEAFKGRSAGEELHIPFCLRDDPSVSRRQREDGATLADCDTRPVESALLCPADREHGIVPPTPILPYASFGPGVGRCAGFRRFHARHDPSYVEGERRVARW